LSDPDSRVCEAAAFALESIGPAAQTALPIMLQALREPAPNSCQVVDIGPATTEVLMETGWTVRWAVARALGTIGGDAGLIVPAMAGALADPNWQVRGMTALSLGQLGYPETVPPLIGAIGDEIPAVRKAAAVALGAIGPAAREALTPLATASRDDNKDVREEAAKAVQKINATSP
jgi:HEAT repeat protein